jgi:hypothetical protein
MTELILDPLEKALVQLESGILESRTEPDNALLRDGVIQRFEYTMALCRKLIQRFLRHIAQVEDSAIRTRKDLFREGARLGLLENVEAWFGYYEPGTSLPTRMMNRLPGLCTSRQNDFFPMPENY